MHAPSAFAFVVLVWSTTPIAIKLSNHSVPPIWAVSARMCIALAIGFIILMLMRKPLVKNRRDWFAFSAAALGLYPMLAILYWSATHVASGLIAVIFGLYPFLIGLFSLIILKQNIFNLHRTVAMAIAILGLVVINLDQLSGSTDALIGILGVFASVVCFALSSVWLKSAGSNVEAIRQLVGALVVATPPFIVHALFTSGVPRFELSTQSIIGITYLSIAASIFGHTAFFFVVKRYSVSTLGLITLLTPVIAIFISMVFAGEHIGWLSLMGSVLVVVSLAIYQQYFLILYRWIKRFKKTDPIVKANQPL